MTAPSAEARLARASTFLFCSPSRDEVRLERREQEDGSVLWAILRSSSAWTREGEWEYEPMGSRRDDAYLKRARWTFEEAWAECERIERDHGFHLPAEEALSRCLAVLGAMPTATVEHHPGGVSVWVPTDDDPIDVLFPRDIGRWSIAEARSVVSNVVRWCHIFEVKVDLSAGASS